MAATSPFPHCRTCSTQDDTSSELRRGDPPDGGEQLAAPTFQGRGALARYLCVLLSLGEPEPFVPGFDTGDGCGVTVPSCCMACKGCRDQHLRMLLCVCWCPWEGMWEGMAPSPLGPWEGSGLLSLAGSLPLPQPPTHSSCPCGNGSGTGEGAVGLCQDGISCSCILGSTPSLRGREKGNVWA